MKKKTKKHLIEFYKDRDTRQFVYYIPSLELSGYGNTEEKAFKMLKFSLEDLFANLIELWPKQRKAELAKYCERR
jgi:hypothetical protein